MTPSFWQSHLWADILSLSGQAEFTEFFSSEWVTILIEYRSIGLGMMGAFSLGTDSASLSDTFLESARNHIRTRGGLFWQIEDYDPKNASIVKNSSTYGKHFLEPWTRVIDLSLTEDALLGQMHEKGRYNIRLAERRWVTTEWAPASKENVDTWMDILTDTTARDGFSQNSRTYYETFLSTLEKNNAWGLLFASYEGRVIAAGIWVFSDEVVIYYYGASISDRELRKHMAPYLLQWEAMREGKRRKCQYYDFLGIAPPDAILSHLAGVSEFKEKFWGTVTYIGTKKYFPLSWKAWLFSGIRTIRNIFRKKY